jgi:hypothetical protein
MAMARRILAERDRLRAAVTALLDYERTGAPEWPDWDQYFDALRAALKEQP